jgi:multiple sugar transport system substrate-binding protein
MQPKSPLTRRLFAPLLVAAAAGCSGRPAGVEGPQPFRDKVVRVACPGSPAAAVVQAYAKAWASREGARVEVVAYDPAAGPDAGTPADAWVVPPAVLPRLAAAGLLRPVPKALAQPDNPFGWSDLLPLYRERLLVWDRTAYALPLLGESAVCCYRADWLADPARREAFERKYKRPPAPPATWEEFADLAEFFRDARPGGPGPSLPPLPAADAALGREFFAVAACYARRAVREDEPPRGDQDDQLFSFHYDHRTGRPRVDTPGFVHALRLLQRLQACRPKEAGAGPAAAFRDGKAGLCLTDAAHVSDFQKAPALRDQFGVCAPPGGAVYFDYALGKEQSAPQPNRVPYLGSAGCLAAVPQAAAEPDAAASLLADLSGRDRSAQILVDPRHGGGATRRSHFEHTRWDAFGLDPERTRDLKELLRQAVAHPGLKNPAVRLRTPDEAAHEAALVGGVRAALAGGADPAAALAGVVNRWDELDRAKGVAAHLAAYRISLGLLPQP